MGSILNDCGKFSENLINMAGTIINRKKENGEQINEKEIEAVEQKVFESYQTVLSIATDINSIDLAISNLERAVNNGNMQVEKIATSIAKEAVTHVQNLANLDEENQEVSAEENAMAVASIIIGSDLEKEDKVDMPEKMMDSMFDDTMTTKMDNIFDKIKKGSFKSIIAAELLEKVTYFANDKPKLSTEKDLRAGLIFLKRLSITDSTTCHALLEKLCHTWKLDVFEKQEDGKEVFSAEKLQEVIKKHCPKLAERPDSYFEKLNEQAARDAIKNGKYENTQELNAEDWKIAQTQKSKKAIVRKELSEAVKNEDSEKIVKLFLAKKELVTDILKDKTRLYSEHMIKRPHLAQNKNIIKMKNDIFYISDLVKSASKYNEIVKTENEVDFEENRIINSVIGQDGIEIKNNVPDEEEFDYI